MATVNKLNLSLFNGHLLEKHDFDDNAAMKILKEHHFYYDWRGANVQDIQQFIKKLVSEGTKGYFYCNKVGGHIVMVLTVDGIDDDELYLSACRLCTDSKIKLYRDPLVDMSMVTLLRNESSLFEIFESAIQTESIQYDYSMRFVEDDEMFDDKDVIVLEIYPQSSDVLRDGSIHMPFALFVCNLYDLTKKYTNLNNVNVSKYINDKFGYINDFSD